MRFRKKVQCLGQKGDVFKVACYQRRKLLFKLNSDQELSRQLRDLSWQLHEMALNFKLRSRVFDRSLTTHDRRLTAVDRSLVDPRNSRINNIKIDLKCIKSNLFQKMTSVNKFMQIFRFIYYVKFISPFV